MTTKCHDCPATVTNATAHQRSVSFKLVVLCRPCAHARGWIQRAKVA